MPDHLHEVLSSPPRRLLEPVLAGQLFAEAILLSCLARLAVERVPPLADQVLLFLALIFSAILLADERVLLLVGLVLLLLALLFCRALRD